MKKRHFNFCTLFFVFAVVSFAHAETSNAELNQSIAAFNNLAKPLKEDPASVGFDQAKKIADAAHDAVMMMAKHENDISAAEMTAALDDMKTIVGNFIRSKYYTELKKSSYFGAAYLDFIQYDLDFGYRHARLAAMRKSLKQ